MSQRLAEFQPCRPPRPGKSRCASQSASVRSERMSCSTNHLSGLIPGRPKDQIGLAIGRSAFNPGTTALAGAARAWAARTGARAQRMGCGADLFDRRPCRAQPAAQRPGLPPSRRPVGSAGHGGFRAGVLRHPLICRRGGPARIGPRSSALRSTRPAAERPARAWRDARSTVAAGAAVLTDVHMRVG